MVESSRTLELAVSSLNRLTVRTEILWRMLDICTNYMDAQRGVAISLQFAILSLALVLFAVFSSAPIWAFIPLVIFGLLSLVDFVNESRRFERETTIFRLYKALLSELDSLDSDPLAVKVKMFMLEKGIPAENFQQEYTKQYLKILSANGFSSEAPVEAGPS